MGGKGKDRMRYYFCTGREEGGTEGGVKDCRDEGTETVAGEHQVHWGALQTESEPVMLAPPHSLPLPLFTVTPSHPHRCYQRLLCMSV